MWFCPKSRPVHGDGFYSKRHLKNSGIQITGFNFLVQTPTTRKAEKQKIMETLQHGRTRAFKIGQRICCIALESNSAPCDSAYVSFYATELTHSCLYQMHTDSAPNLTSNLVSWTTKQSGILKSFEFHPHRIRLFPQYSHSKEKLRVLLNNINRLVL